MQLGAEYGVGCERCHGPGSKHIQEAKAAQPGQKPGAIVRGLDDLTSLQQSQICARCHARMTNINNELAFPDKTRKALSTTEASCPAIRTSNSGSTSGDMPSIRTISSRMNGERRAARNGKISAMTSTTQKHR
jgi:hypothetical protein